MVLLLVLLLLVHTTDIFNVIYDVKMRVEEIRVSERDYVISFSATNKLGFKLENGI
jgi:hypothetical protein